MSKYHRDKAKYIKEVAIRVTNIERSIAFYKNILGFEIIDKADEVGLGFDNRVLLRLKQVGTPKQYRAAGLYHIAYLVPNREALANWLYFHLHNNTNIDGASNHGVSEAIYFRDPDGNGIEVYADTPDETWDWHNQEIKMITEALDIDDLFTLVTTPTNKLPKETIIGHVHLSVLDLDKSQDFYHLLGFNTVLDMGTAAFLSSQNYHHHLGMNIWGMKNARAHLKTQADVDYLVIKYPNEDELNKALQRLANRAHPYKNHNHYYQVIDNNGINLHLLF